MKVGRRKMTMRKPIDCEERNRLRTERSVSLAEWDRCTDDLRATTKNDPTYQRKVAIAKDAQKRFKGCDARASEHEREHGCW
jgi:hypothetical protein